MDLSIIIPVYNTPEKSLLNCFTSIKVLPAIEYEVIVVDDGSEEEVGEFCRNYANTHEYFRYVYQKNRGVSAARNAGIAQASGKYIMFLDADDELIQCDLIQKYLKTDNEIVVFNIVMHEGTHIQETKVFERKRRVAPCKKDFVVAACNNRLNSSCAKLFLRTFLLDNGICFDETMVVAEDAKFVFTAIMAAVKLHYEDISMYQYNHSHDNGDRRLARYPKRIIQDSLCLHQMRKDMLKENVGALQLSDIDIQELNTAISAQAVKDLFEAVGSLLLMGYGNDDMRGEPYQLLIALGKPCSNHFTFLTRMKYVLLKYDLKPLIKLHAYLRKQYLNTISKENKHCVLRKL